jgi:hypothetical protein
MTLPHGCAGEVAYLFVYDLADEMTRESIPQLLGQPIRQHDIETGRRHIPKMLTFFKPQVASLPSSIAIGPDGDLKIAVDVMILPIGALIITASVPLQSTDLGGLLAYYDLRVKNRSLEVIIHELAQRAAKELRPWCIRPVGTLVPAEPFTVFMLDAVPDECGDAQQWLQANRATAAALLTRESDPTRLSDQEVADSTAGALSYYRDDLMVVDWNAALVIDEQIDRADDLYVLQLARLQLTEIQAYDRELDAVLERAYRELANTRHGVPRSSLAELRNIRLDLARLRDEVQNISKFLGDWHLARVHEACVQRFHLPAWYQVVDGKLQTLDQLHRVAVADRQGRQMLILEALIVILFVADLLMLAFGGH